MNSQQKLVGRVVGVDPRLLEDPHDLAVLTMGARHELALSFFTPNHRLITLAAREFGAGPDRILVERIPAISQPLPSEGWKVESGFLTVPGAGRFDLTAVPRLPSTGLSVIREFPGHMRGAIARQTRQTWPDLEHRLHDLAGALKKRLTEEVEIPILKVIGFGPGTRPIGDMALCGMLLTGRAMGLGNRTPVHWLARLSMEVRRFRNRTTRFSAAHLHYALEGRTTQCEEAFFSAMARDFEGAVDIALQNILKERHGAGPGFLVGVRMALDMVRSDFFSVPAGSNPAF